MRILTQLLSESGLPSLILSPRDTKVICLQRFVRNFGYGATSIHLTFFLGNLGNNEERLGLFMSLTLWGDVIISLVLTAWGDSLGRKNILLIGSALMFASGVIFATCRSYWTLLLAAIVGVISPRQVRLSPLQHRTRTHDATVVTRSVPSARSKSPHWPSSRQASTAMMSSRGTHCSGSSALPQAPSQAATSSRI